MILPPEELGLSCYVLEPPVLQHWGFAEGIACCLLLFLAPSSFQALAAVCISPFIAFGSAAMGGAVFLFFT